MKAKTKATTGTVEESDIKDVGMAPEGLLRIEWAANQMPVLKMIAEEFATKKPFTGMRIGACLHVTTETANLMLALKAGGAQVSLCASNPLSTQDDTAAALVTEGIQVFAIKGENTKTYHDHLDRVLDSEPEVLMDDGADLHGTVHLKRKELIRKIIGGTEETTTGLVRLRSMEKEGALAYPVIGVNDARTKHLFDNRYGTGQSTIDGILRATNILLAGKTFVVSGYGWCGRGIAMRARGMGAKVIVTEIDPLKALEAVMDGYDVMPMKEAAKRGEIFVTVTGNSHVISREHLRFMKDGAVLANSGHFNVEIDTEALASISVRRRSIREFVEEFTLDDGKRLFLLGEGRLINLAAAEGHPASVMDMSFANQALSAEFFTKIEKKMDRRVYRVPDAIDDRIAKLKLESMGILIDSLTGHQEHYLASWKEGT